MKQEHLDLSISIWTDFYKRSTTVISESKLFNEAQDLCKCFGISPDAINEGKKIAYKNVRGDK